jgi:hypothetical protein
MAFAPWLFRGAPLWLMLVVQATHVLQPDAVQATGLALGIMPLLGRRLLLRAALLGLAAVAWLRSEPLAPVAHVEEIFTLIGALGPLWVAMAVVSGALLLAPCVLDGERRALGLYLGVVTLAGCFVPHPVPVFGAGAGPVIGWYAMVGRRRSAEP